MFILRDGNTLRLLTEKATMYMYVLLSLQLVIILLIAFVYYKLQKI